MSIPETPNKAKPVTPDKNTPDKPYNPKQESRNPDGSKVDE